MAARDLVDRWDDQQAAYIAQREERFAVMTDVVALAIGAPRRVLDLACGPGSTSARFLRRFAGVEVVSVDLDPALLALARRHLAPWGDRVHVVDADLTDDAWPDAVRAAAGDEPFDAVVSTTALHWLMPEQLVRVYRQAHALLRDGGVLLNGDHFRFDARTPVMRDWAARHDQATQDAASTAGVEPWDVWWAAASADPEVAPLLAERERRFAGRDGTPSTAVDFQLAALAQAGFTETGTAWQLFDDYVVYASR